MWFQLRKSTLTTSSKIFQLKSWVRASVASTKCCTLQDVICLRSPSLLTQLEQDTRTVDAALDANKAKQAEAIVRPAQDEQSFKDELNHDLMAFQLLQGGVDGFIKARDQLSLLLRQSFGIDAEIKS